MNYWLGSFCRVINNGKLYFPINVVAISDIIKLEKDLGNQIPDKSWMLYLLEIFNFKIKDTNFNYKTSNQFTGIEWWNKTGSFIYPIRYQIEISQLMFGLVDKNHPESITFFPHNVLVPNKDSSINDYPITFRNVRSKDNCICYTISYGLCNNGLGYS